MNEKIVKVLVLKWEPMLMYKKNIVAWNCEISIVSCYMIRIRRKHLNINRIKEKTIKSVRALWAILSHPVFSISSFSFSLLWHHAIILHQRCEHSLWAFICKQILANYTWACQMSSVISRDLTKIIHKKPLKETSKTTYKIADSFMKTVTSFEVFEITKTSGFFQWSRNLLSGWASFLSDLLLWWISKLQGFSV